MKQKYLDKLQEYEEYLKAKQKLKEKYKQKKREITPNVSINDTDTKSESQINKDKKIIIKKNINYSTFSEIVNERDWKYELKGQEEKKKQKEEELEKLREKQCEKYGIIIPPTSLGIPKNYDLPKYSNELIVDKNLISNIQYLELIENRD